MVNETVRQRSPCRHQTRFRIEIPQFHGGLNRSARKSRQTVDINVVVSRIHEHNVKRFDQSRINRPGLTIAKELTDKTGEDRIIDPGRKQDVSRETCARNIALGGGANDLCLVPERLESTPNLIHDVAAGIVVATHHELGRDKPLFPFEPRRVIRQLIDHDRQFVGTAGR